VTARDSLAKGRSPFATPGIPAEDLGDYPIQRVFEQLGIGAPDLPAPTPRPSPPREVPSHPNPAHGPKLDCGMFSFVPEYLCTVRAKLRDKPEVLGETPQGLRINYGLAGGVALGPKLQARISWFGGDWMTVRRDGIGTPSIRATFITPDRDEATGQAAMILGEYSGTLDFGGPEAYAKVARGDDWHEPLPLLLAPKFITAAKQYLWLNRVQCYGVGQVLLDNLLVQYDVYAVHPGSIEVIDKGSP
jgi:hypothetical protein